MQSETIDLFEYWNILWRRKLLISGLFVAAVALAVLLTFILTPYYRSETVLIASGAESGGLGAAFSSIPLAAALTAGSGIQLPSDKVLIVMNSRSIAESVISRFDLMRVFFEDDWDKEKNAWKDPEDPPLLQDALRLLRDDVVSVTRSKEGAISVAVVWKDAKLAADIANQYVAATTQLLNEKSITVTVQVVDRAVPAQRKHRPKLIILVNVAGALALAAGVLSAFILETLQRRKAYSNNREDPPS